MSTETISKLFETFLTLRRQELAAGTVEIYRWAFSRLTAVLGDKPAADVTAMDAMTWAASLAESGLRPATGNMYLRAVKCFFNWLVAARLLAESPFAGVKQRKDSARGKKIFTPAEVERLLAATLSDRWRLIILLAVTTGMRRGEILNLTVDRIDFAGGVINLDRVEETPHTWAWDLKDHEARMLPITAETERTLLRVLDRLPAGQPYLCLTPARYRRQITTRDRLAAQGKPLPASAARCPVWNFNRDFQQLCDRANVPYRTFHALRGASLMIMAQNGLQPHEVQAIAGHSDVRTTYQHYVRPSVEINRAHNAAFRPSYGR